MSTPGRLTAAAREIVTHIASLTPPSPPTPPTPSFKPGELTDAAKRDPASAFDLAAEPADRHLAAVAAWEDEHGKLAGAVRICRRAVEIDDPLVYVETLYRLPRTQQVWMSHSARKQVAFVNKLLASRRAIRLRLRRLRDAEAALGGDPVSAVDPDKLPLGVTLRPLSHSSTTRRPNTYTESRWQK